LLTSLLLPFLYKGFIIEYFSLSGKIPLVITLLHIYLRGELIKGAVILSNLVEISLYLYEFFGLRVLIMFSISVVVVGLL